MSYTIQSADVANHPTYAPQAVRTPNSSSSEMPRKPEEKR
jgi:hypothetical protein